MFISNIYSKIFGAVLCPLYLILVTRRKINAYIYFFVYNIHFSFIIRGDFTNFQHRV